MNQFSITVQNLTIEARLQQKGIYFQILSLLGQGKVRKYIAQAPILGPYSLFTSLSDLHEYFKTRQNFSWLEVQKQLKINIKVIGSNYEKENKISIRFTEIELKDKELMEYENRLLKKQLEYYKSKQQKGDGHGHARSKIKSEGKESMMKVESSQKNQSEDVEIISNVKGEEILVSSSSPSPSPSSSSSSPQSEQKPEKTETVLTPRAGKNNFLFNKRSRKGLPLLLGDRIQYLIKAIGDGKVQQKEEDSHEEFETVRIQKNKEKKIKKDYKPKFKNKSTKKIEPREEKGKEKSKEKSKEPEKQQDCTIKGLKLIEISRKNLGNNIFEVKFKNGSVYNGEMKGNEFHGKGTYETGLFIFDGNWRNGQTYGVGITYYKNGSIEKGFYHPGWKRYGPGEDRYKNGESYIGEFRNEKKNGQGTYHFDNGDFYKGNWKDDEQHGFGIEHYKSTRSRFEGTWLNDQKDGEGLLISSRGKTKQIWSKGRLLQQFLIIE